MNRLAPPHHGTVLARGYVIDRGLLGDSAAQERVLGRWSTGASLHALNPDRWVLLLPQPESVRCAAAPGLPLDEGSVRDGTVCFVDAGSLREADLNDLEVLDPAQWLDLDHWGIHELVPCEPAPPPFSSVETQPTAPAVDLRSRATVGQPSTQTKSIVDEIAGRAARRGVGAAPARPPRDRLARLLMKSPAGPQIARRHRKYLEQLTAEFERKDYAQALRDAIALGGTSAYLSLRLPGRRTQTDRPTAQRRGGGGAIPLGMTVQQHLQQLYRSAAEDLERQGRHQEAAFVLADLMNSAVEAVALLERHGHLVDAAELAEGRKLDPAEVVRLWWRAGNRPRAVAIAKARDAYAAAVTRLEKVDANAAVDLRREWSASLSRTGDHLAAVKAAWPAPELRAETQRDIAVGLSLGGVVAAHLFAYQLAMNVTPEGMSTALRLIATEDADLLESRDSFLAAYAELPSADATSDRQLSTAALRLVLGRNGPSIWDNGLRRTVHNALRERADPLLKEDLPTGFTSGSAPSTSPMSLILGGAPGQVEVLDAAPMSGGTVLVANGSLGLRLLGRDGRVRAHWDLPAHQVVRAHHGGSAIIATSLGEGSWELHRFDLASRRVSRWIVIRAARIVRDFDGVLFTFVDHTGTLVFLDVEAPHARVVWTELNDTSQAVDVAATATEMSALVRHPAARADEAVYEVWVWAMPQRALRWRSKADLEEVTSAAVTADGNLVCLEDASDSEGYNLYTLKREQKTMPRHVTEADGLLVSGVSHALSVGDTLTVVTPLREITITAPGAKLVMMRSSDTRLVLWDDQARLGVVDLATGQLLTSGPANL